ncbi:hypothetical protein JQS43_25700 [Natronosporangium hydrolyticum]|uniref:Uncharacterized protein n=1 Tax=Natronosporangium hydrolyticum TaxID=2811111 RepID=A0A895YFA6_9ACTN|nr:hypothetical protein [Natronosporangium hydrolyticum]QSB14795.1 hypothetical protein JQS43_25700 [Natronosporangium hydrolyticum]
MPSPLPSARAPRRGLAVVAAAALVGAPLLTSSVAGATGAAEPVADQPPVITFTGGCGLLGIGGISTPDVATAQVTAGSQLRFGNQLGQRATVWLGEQPEASVPAGGTADVTFSEVGTVPVSMQISCLIGKPVGEVTVDVVPKGTPSAGPPSAGPPSASPPSASPPPASGPPGGIGTPTESAGAGAGDGVAPPESGSAENGSAEGGGDSPNGGGSAASPDGPGAAPPANSDGNPGGGQLDSPADGPMSEPGGAEPAPDRSSAVEGGAELEEAATVNPPNAGQSGDMAPASRTRGDDGLIGLLALVATICLVGASVGAARVLVSRRVSAAKWA